MNVLLTVTSDAKHREFNVPLDTATLMLDAVIDAEDVTDMCNTLKAGNDWRYVFGNVTVNVLANWLTLVE